MTVSSVTTKNSYSGDGSTTAFSYTFKVFAQGDITVILRTDTDGTEVVQTISTDYTVSGVGDANGGNVTFTTAPATGKTIVLLRATSQTQNTDYTPNDPFPAESHEDALDKLTFITQELEEELGRSIKLSRTNTITSTEFSVGSTERANKILAFDGNGELAVTQEIGTFRGDWATATDYSGRDIVKDDSNDNVYIINTAHTSSGSTPLSSNANSSYYDLIVDAEAAATSATNAATSATAASNSATAAATSASNAGTSENNAASSATSASADAVSAGNAKTAAETAQTAAEAAQSAAETAETNAETAETAAETAQAAAAASQTAAATSATNAATSESNASTSATTATTKASEASTSATNAATSATNASTSESNASTSATNAATSETNAATSESNAATSATDAANSAAAAAASFDSFDDRYLGVKSSDPTVDNDGNALVEGALYFSSTDNEMKVYDGANWIAATSAGSASLILYQYTATASQTTFSGTDDNSATLSYTANNIQVTLNGVILDPADYTATNGTSVVLASGAAASDELNIFAFKSFTVADTVSASAGGTFTGDVTLTGADLDVGGTVTADDNIVLSGASTPAITITDTTNNAASVLKAGNVQGITGTTSNHDFFIRSNDTNRIGVAAAGDISFYEDTGTTPKFFWDASAESLGIGTSSPASKLDVTGTVTADDVVISDANPTLTFFETDTTNLNTKFDNGGGDLYIQTVNDDGSSPKTRLLLDHATGDISFYEDTGSAPKLTWDASAESLGIGTSSPTYALDVRDTGESWVRADSSTTNNDAGYRFAHAGVNHYVISHQGSDDTLLFYDNIAGKSRLRINSSGLVGINTTSPAAFLDIDNAGATTQTLMTLKDSGGTGTHSQIQFSNTNGVVGQITTSGSSTTYSTSSDHRLKENAVDLTGAITRVKSLQPKRFNFIADDSTTVDGFMAHEAATVVPEAVVGTHNEVDADGNPVYQGIDQAKLVPLLTGALQEAITKIETLETEMTALKARVTTLENA